MKVNDNISSLQAYTHLLRTGRNMERSVKRLSSGYKINSSADDAAGHAISNKLRNQINGMSMAARNSLDAVSLVGTAEGALNEVHAMLHRIRELAVQAANDTNEPDDREKMQLEIEQLFYEINDIAYKTEFNTIKIIGGEGETMKSTAIPGDDFDFNGLKIQIGANKNMTLTLNIPDIRRIIGEVAENHFPGPPMVSFPPGFHIHPDYENRFIPHPDGRNMLIPSGTDPIRLVFDFREWFNDRPWFDDDGPVELLPVTPAFLTLEDNGWYRMGAGGTPAAAAAAGFIPVPGHNDMFIPNVAAPTAFPATLPDGLIRDYTRPGWFRVDPDADPEFEFDPTQGFTPVPGNNEFWYPIPPQISSNNSMFTRNPDSMGTYEEFPADSGRWRPVPGTTDLGTLLIDLESDIVIEPFLPDFGFVRHANGWYHNTNNIDPNDALAFGFIPVPLNPGFFIPNVAGVETATTPGTVPDALEHDYPAHPGWFRVKNGETFPPSEWNGWTPAPGFPDYFIYTGDAPRTPFHPAGMPFVNNHGGTRFIPDPDDSTRFIIDPNSSGEFVINNATAFNTAGIFFTEDTSNSSLIEGQYFIHNPDVARAAIKFMPVDFFNDNNNQNLNILPDYAGGTFFILDPNNPNRFTVSPDSDGVFFLNDITGFNTAGFYFASDPADLGLINAFQRVNVLTVANATATMLFIDDAIEAISKVRSRLGAYENRLRHTEANLNATREHTETALSRVKDTDMAYEMTKNVQYSVIQQAGIAILGQANARPQQILQLLR